MSVSDGVPVFDRAVPAGRLMAATDWAASPIGPVDRWSETLRVLVRTVQSSRYPMLLLWGDEYTQIYNDAYSVLIGERHPAAMGNDCRITLAEGWPVLEPILEEAKTTGVASWVPALLLLLIRAGYREEAYFSVSHAPVTETDGQVAGVLAVCSEVTPQVLSERRLALLQRLSLREDPTARVEDVADDVVHVLREGTLDVPFAGVYLREGSRLRLVAATHDGLPATVRPGGEDPWRLLEGLGGRRVEVAVPPGLDLRGGAWTDPVTDALVLPLPSSDPAAPLGVLVAGVSPSRALDEPYSSFFALLGQQVATGLRNALAYEEERRRAEELAELDRVKTEFFTNVSHEFRTPLTLMLGPLGDALQDAGQPLPEEQRLRVETARAASERLLKLVNDLLTFSSVQSGSTSADSRPLDLSALTVDVTSAFRAAVERSGLALDVHCPPGDPVRVDPEHWTTIVSNLLSNALKFTFTGAIRVELAHLEDGARLTVADTGVGIPAEELPRLFQRFHRVRGTRSRSHEGSGIGLSLVRELVALHGGRVEVTSEEGHGTTFTVDLPHAPAPTAAGPATEAGSQRLAPAVAEAESWLQDGESRHRPGDAGAARGDALRVLVADDNADMRDHVSRLLAAEGWHVEAVRDGAAALEAARTDPPDVVLTDVMMPGLDGFELLRALRSDPLTRRLPVVILSARAGEGASAEGLDLGADDYVVKPFTSADLVARLRSTVHLARLRSEHAEDLRHLARMPSVEAGQPVEESLEVVAERVRSLLGARRTTVVLEQESAVPVVAAALDPDAGTAEPDDAGVDELRAPVRARDGGALGVVVAWLDPVRAHQPDAEALLEAAAGVLGVLVEDGRLQQREAQVTTSLQSFLLPESLPSVPGLELAAEYRPAEREVEVGGDWYDVLPLPDGRVAVSVGDVAGQGLASALLMAQLRAAVRACTLGGMPPGEVLGRLDDLLERAPDGGFCTLFLGYLDAEAGELEWASAGHPPPVLLVAGQAQWLEGESGPPVGAMLGAGAAVNRTPFPAGTTLVLYTDGLVEDRASQLDVGMPGLLALLAAHAGAEPEQLVARLAAAGGRDDDTAVLVVRRTPVAAQDPAPQLRDRTVELTFSAQPQAASQARAAVRRELDGARVDEQVAFELLVGLSEAVNNAVEHPVDPTEPVVVVRVEVDAERRLVRLEVRDFGRWRPRRSSMDRGHGSVLMAGSGEVSVVPEPDGTRVRIERVL